MNQPRSDDGRRSKSMGTRSATSMGSPKRSLHGYVRGHGNTRRSSRRPRFSLYWSVGLLVLAWLLGAVLALLGYANRRAVNHIGGEALEGRALDMALNTVSTIVLLRPDGLQRLQEAVEAVATAPVLSVAVVGPEGRVVACSNPDWIGTRPWPRLTRRMRVDRESHMVRRVPGRSGAFEVWLPLRGPRRPPRAWKRLWRMWRRWHPGVAMPDGHCNHAGCAGSDSLDPSADPGRDATDMGAPDRDVAPPFRNDGPKGPRRFGRGGPGMRHGRRAGRMWPGAMARAGLRPFMRLVVDVDAPSVRRAMVRARSIQLFTFLGALVLVLISSVMFAADLRSSRLAREMEQKARLAEMGEMAAVLAHEIRNPLGVIKGNAQLAMERDSSSQSISELETVVNQAGRLERLVNALLDYAGPLPPHKVSVDLTELVDETCQLVVPLAAEGNVAIVRELEAVRGRVERDQIQQVLLNVLRNAVEASPKDAVVTVSLACRGRHAVITITDSGPGFRDEVLAKLFRPFVTTKVTGTGLGLALSRRIVEQHGGVIRAENIEDRGARVTVDLPGCNSV